MIQAVIAIILAVFLAGTHWKAYHSGGKNTAAKMEVKFQAERNDWQGKVDAAKAVTQKQAAENRAASDAANAEHNVALAKINAQLRGSKNEINRLSDNLSSCRLLPDLVRLLNDQRSALDAGTGKN